MIAMVSAHCQLDKSRVSWEADCPLSVPMGDYHDYLSCCGDMPTVGGTSPWPENVGIYKSEEIELSARMHTLSHFSLLLTMAVM